MHKDPSIYKCPAVCGGSWLYDGRVRLPLRIVQSPIRHGSGDYEDAADVSDDIEVDCFYLIYQTIDGKDVGGGSYNSVEAAKRAAFDVTNGTAVFEEATGSPPMSKLPGGFVPSGFSHINPRLN